MKYIAYLILLFSTKILAQTSSPILIINLDKIGVYEDNVNYQLDNLNITTVVFKDSFSFPVIYSCIEQEKNTFTIRDNNAYIYFSDTSCNSGTIVKKGNLIALSIKLENKLMNVFFKSNIDIGIDRALHLENLSFKEGIYIYRSKMTDKNVELEMKTLLDMSNIHLTPIEEKTLNNLLK